MNNETNANMDAKQCTRCGTVKTLDRFKFRDKTHTARIAVCRTCENEYLRTRYRKLHPPRPEPTDRTCIDCGSTKPIAEFDKRRRCRPCDYARRKATHPTGVADRSRRYREHRGDQINRRRRERYKTNPALRQRTKERLAKWKTSNRERWLESKRRQSARRYRRKRAAQASDGSSGPSQEKPCG